MKDQPAASVLVVEDDVLLRFNTSEFLRDCGFEVLEASTADEAVFVLSADPNIDVVFSDIRMPGTMDGFDLAKWVEANCPSIPIILTSGYPGVDAGKYAHPMLPKPYSLVRVQNEITKALHCG
jgi:CheY-like chemotaxis protein